jgi:DNA repair exonuclease SbcCD ATPase subunit
MAVLQAGLQGLQAAHGALQDQVVAEMQPLGQRYEQALQQQEQRLQAGVLAVQAQLQDRYGELSAEVRALASSHDALAADGASAHAAAAKQRAQLVADVEQLQAHAAAAKGEAPQVAAVLAAAAAQQQQLEALQDSQAELQGKLQALQAELAVAGGGTMHAPEVPVAAPPSPPAAPDDDQQQQQALVMDLAEMQQQLLRLQEELAQLSTDVSIMGADLGAAIRDAGDAAKQVRVCVLVRVCAPPAAGPLPTAAHAQAACARGSCLVRCLRHMPHTATHHTPRRPRSCERLWEKRWAACCPRCS